MKIARNIFCLRHNKLKSSMIIKMLSQVEKERETHSDIDDIHYLVMTSLETASSRINNVEVEHLAIFLSQRMLKPLYDTRLRLYCLSFTLSKSVLLLPKRQF